MGREARKGKIWWEERQEKVKSGGKRGKAPIDTMPEYATDH